MPSSVPPASVLSVHAVGGPTAVIEYGGLRLLTDPTFDEPGDYVPERGLILSKLAPAGLAADQVGPVDAVLLSHDQHADNLDTGGRLALAKAPLTVTTPASAARLGGTARGLAPWESLELARPAGGPVVVTAVPARHGPEGCEPVTGDVTGFVLTGPGLPTVYVSGDNASMGNVREIAHRAGPVDTALLFAGAVRTRLFGGALLTLDSAQAAEATAVLGARRVVPLHFNSWMHFTEGAAHLRVAFEAAGLADRLVLLAPGESAVVGPSAHQA
ncbi:MBL fold metallo-hydrolase [Kitasatospora herbaricolor]|uniref:MBL fold metallo-hydrolase n=1 Tax=Kitasatospora herbaricolor TaxID=68217 RepID=UPI00174B5C9C|nr:MBL fold metallo-hydrolase [Kitasatospora herbaricolor]MDQ0306058.1 L-ascorbate metabolism protein UlaG (beta-lactamase superfamily) [Kitasatospora herbaricolor]GGV23611.1 MBL fold metallo-hydrolase [Kitasatospora herbaricolor]